MAVLFPSLSFQSGPTRVLGGLESQSRRPIPGKAACLSQRAVEPSFGSQLPGTADNGMGNDYGSREYLEAYSIGVQRRERKHPHDGRQERFDAHSIRVLSALSLASWVYLKEVPCRKRIFSYADIDLTLS